MGLGERRGSPEMPELGCRPFSHTEQLMKKAKKLSSSTRKFWKDVSVSWDDVVPVVCRRSSRSYRVGDV